jgi:hypothetical protein
MGRGSPSPSQVGWEMRTHEEGGGLGRDGERKRHPKIQQLPLPQLLHLLPSLLSSHHQKPFPTKTMATVITKGLALLNTEGGAKTSVR